MSEKNPLGWEFCVELGCYGIHLTIAINPYHTNNKKIINIIVNDII